MMKRHLLFGSLAVACGLVATSQFLPSAEGLYVPRSENAEVASEGIAGAIEYMNKLRANPETGVVDPQDVLRARRAVDKMPSSKSFVEWTELGPDNVGGRTRAILIDRNNPSRMYAGGVAGGVWYSDNGGQSWYRQDNNGVDMNVAVVSMAQAANGDIYVGTGEGMYYFASGGKSMGILGEGMYKSTDGGKTFQLLTETVPSSANASTASWASIGKIECDPVNPNRIYASTNKGLMISSDGGETWQDEGLQGTSASRDVEVASDGTVYLQYGSGVFVSPTGDPGSFGTNFGDALDVPNASSSRIELAVAPSDPATIYAVTTVEVSPSVVHHSGIHVSYDRGATWETINNGYSLSFDPLGRQGSYNLAFEVFPNNKDKFILGGVQLWAWEKGKNFVRIGSEARFPGNSLYVHADKHVVTFHPTNPNVFYIGSDGGVGFSSDGGKTFSQRNKGYAVTQFYTLDVTSDGYMIGGTQDNSTPFLDGSGISPLAARIVGGGDGAAVVASKLRKDNLVFSSQNGNSLRSSNGGNTGTTLWPQTMTNKDFYDTDESHPDYVGTPGQGGFAPFIAAVSMWENFSDKDDYFVLASVSNGLWMGRNTWDFAVDPIMHRISNSGNAQCISISADGDVAYVGYSQGRIDRYTGLLGATDSLNSHYASDQSVVEKTVLSIPGGRLVTDVAINPNDPSEIVVTLGGYSNTANVYYSSNGLDATPVFTDISSNLPRMPIYSATFVDDGGVADMVLLGTEFGVMGTTDIGAGTVSWEVQNTGFDRVPTFALKQVVSKELPNINGYIYASTHGRGAFKSTRRFVGVKELSGVEASESSLNLYPNPAVDVASVDLALTESANVSVEIYDLSGKLVKQTNLGMMTKGTQTVRLNVSDLNEGVYLTKVFVGTKAQSGKLMVTK